MTLTDVFSYNVSNDERAALNLDVLLRSLFTAPAGDGGELQRAERPGAAESQTERRSHPSPRRHDAGRRAGEYPAGAACPLTAGASAHSKMSPVWPELQPLVVHGGRVRGPAASERTGRRRARQPQSSRGLFQTSESADGAVLNLVFPVRRVKLLPVCFYRPNINQ